VLFIEHLIISVRRLYSSSYPYKLLYIIIIDVNVISERLSICLSQPPSQALSMPSYFYHCWDMVGRLFQNCQIKKCCLCAYKSQLYRLNGRQNRLDLYHRSAFAQFYENRLNSCLDHPRWRKSSWFVPRSTWSSTVEKIKVWEPEWP